MSSLLGFAGVGGGSIGRAAVDLVLNATAYQGELAAVEGETKAATTKMGGGFAGLQKSVAGSMSGATAAVAGLAAVTVVAIGKAIGVTQEWAAEVRTLQRVTGEGAEATSGLLSAGNLLNLDIQKLNTGFGVLAKNITTHNAALAEYHVKTTDATGATLPFTEILKNAQDKFQELPPGIEQTGFAMRLFGRSGKEMIPILGKTSEEMEALIEKGREAGLIMSQDDLDASKALSIAQRELGEAFKGAAVTVGKTFIPVATAVVKGIVKIGTTIIQTVAPAFDKLKQAFQNVGDAFGDFYQSLGPAGPLLAKFFGLIAGAPLVLFVALLEAVAAVLNVVAKGFEIAAEGIERFGGPVINAAIDGINFLIAAYNKVIDVSNSVLQTHFEHIDALEHIAPAADEATAGMGRMAHGAAAAAHAVEDAGKAVRVFAGLSGSDLVQFSHDTDSSMSFVEGKFDDLGDTAHLTAGKILTAFRRALNAQANFTHNSVNFLGDVEKHLGPGMQKAAQQMVEALAAAGPEGAQRIQILADANDRQQQHIVAAWMRSHDAAKNYSDKVVDVSNSLRDLDGTTVDVTIATHVTGDTGGSKVDDAVARWIADEIGRANRD